MKSNQREEFKCELYKRKTEGGQKQFIFIFLYSFNQIKFTVLQMAKTKKKKKKLFQRQMKVNLLLTLYCCSH